MTILSNKLLSIWKSLVVKLLHELLLFYSDVNFRFINTCTIVFFKSTKLSQPCFRIIISNIFRIFTVVIDSGGKIIMPY